MAGDFPKFGKRLDKWRETFRSSGNGSTNGGRLSEARETSCNLLCFSHLCKAKVSVPLLDAGVSNSPLLFFCLALRIYRFPSLFVSICEALRLCKSANAKPVKTEKRNILRLSSAPLRPATGMPKALPHRPWIGNEVCAPRLHTSPSLNGLKRIAP